MKKPEQPEEIKKVELSSEQLDKVAGGVNEVGCDRPGKHDPPVRPQ